MYTVRRHAVRLSALKQQLHLWRGSGAGCSKLTAAGTGSSEHLSLAKPRNYHRRRNMSLKCQRDSYLRSVSARVVACDPCAPGAGEGEGEAERYRVTLEDTVLFPGGGGQPCDYGKVNGGPVFEVQHETGGGGGGTLVTHVLGQPVQVGSEVRVDLDWSRRFDHMQQHSAQHLITAIADKEFGYKTTSWSLREEGYCFVELDTKSVPQGTMEAIEDQCNECIRSSIPMVPHWYHTESEELKKVRSRGLPDNFTGNEVRVVEIEGLDANMCCGTHVSSLAHLQCVKLVRCETRKGSSVLVHYVAGGRVLRWVKEASEREKALTKLLQSPTAEHVEAVDRTMKNLRQLRKTVSKQTKEIALLLAAQELGKQGPAVVCMHRKDGDVDFLKYAATELEAKGVEVILVTGGDFFIFAGNKECTTELGPKVTELLGGKAGGRKGWLQGAVANHKNISEAQELVRKWKETYPTN